MDTPDTTTFPTWGYRPDGEARIFVLQAGESLPDGWSPSPAVILDPARATAEALTDRAAGRPYADPQVNAVDVIPAVASPDTAIAEIERLKGIIAAGSQENEDLVAEISKAEDLLTAAAAEVATMRAALEKAQADVADAAKAQGEAATARDEAKAAAERLSAELAEARKDLEAATAPKPAATPAKAK